MTTTAPHRTAGLPDSLPADAAGRYFADDDFDFAARTALGHAAQGMLDVGQVLVTYRRIDNGDPESWFRAWHDLADALVAQATAAAAADRRDTAAALFLGASEAYDQALAFVDGMADQSVLLPAFRRHRECWDRFVGASGGRHLAVAVPYEGDSMPGYLLRPDASGTPRPTVVVSNGSDGSVAGLWATVIKGALDRGWNAFVFDGPGQQSMLFERDVPFRPDWEAVLTPVVDTLVARPDVDADALLAYGISQAGYWLPRALAFEHRFVAACVDSGVMDVGRTWRAHLPAPMLGLLEAGDGQRFDAIMAQGFATPEAARSFAFRARPYGISSPFALFTAVGRYHLHDVVDRIVTPLLITDPQDDKFFPGQPRELFDALPGEKVLVPFTREQGANHHCEPLARGLVSLRMNDFFADHLSRDGR